MTAMIASRVLRGRVPLLIVASVLIGMAACSPFLLFPAKAPQQPQHKSARVNAWEKILPRFHAAEKAGLDSANRHREVIRAFFAERKTHSRAFGDSVLSFWGKWAFVKSSLPFADANAHRQFLREQFEQRVFSGAIWRS